MNKNNNVEVFLETLKELSKDEKVREEIASNPNTPTEILKELSKDEDEKVRARIASNILANKINKTRR